MSKKFFTFTIDSDTLRDSVLDDWQRSPVNEALGHDGNKDECLRVMDAIVNEAESEYPCGYAHFEAWFEDNDYDLKIKDLIEQAVYEYMLDKAKEYVNGVRW